jgi:hypothetical protein
MEGHVLPVPATVGAARPVSFVLVLLVLEGLHVARGIESSAHQCLHRRIDRRYAAKDGENCKTKTLRQEKDI